VEITFDRKETINYIEGLITDIERAIIDLKKCIPQNYKEDMKRLKSGELNDQDFMFLANKIISWSLTFLTPLSDYIRYEVVGKKNSEFYYIKISKTNL